MSQENVEIVRRAFESYNRGDLDAAVADFAPDCEYIPGGAVPGRRGVFRGPEGYKQFVGWLREEFDDARVEVDAITDAGDQVLVSVTVQGRGKQSGVEASWNVWQVWTLRGGKIVGGQGFTSKAEALQAFGLSE
jgi:ketosteroid isomerase-like protein